MSKPFHTRRPDLNETLFALFGETRLGATGASLQWLTLVILFAAPGLHYLFPPLLVSTVLIVAIVAMFGGICLAFRGKSMGPLVVIPAATGVGILLVLTALLYPLRLLFDQNGAETKVSPSKD